MWEKSVEGFDNMVEEISRMGVFLMAPAVAMRLEDARPAGNRW